MSRRSSNYSKKLNEAQAPQRCECSVWIWRKTEDTPEKADAHPELNNPDVLRFLLKLWKTPSDLKYCREYIQELYKFSNCDSIHLNSFEGTDILNTILHQSTGQFAPVVKLEASSLLLAFFVILVRSFEHFKRNKGTWNPSLERWENSIEDLGAFANYMKMIAQDVFEWTAANLKLPTSKQQNQLPLPQVQLENRRKAWNSYFRRFDDLQNKGEDFALQAPDATRPVKISQQFNYIQKVLEASAAAKEQLWARFGRFEKAGETNLGNFYGQDSFGLILAHQRILIDSESAFWGCCLLFGWRGDCFYLRVLGDLRHVLIYYDIKQAQAILRNRLTYLDDLDGYLLYELSGAQLKVLELLGVVEEPDEVFRGAERVKNFYPVWYDVNLVGLGLGKYPKLFELLAKTYKLPNLALKMNLSDQDRKDFERFMFKDSLDVPREVQLVPKEHLTLFSRLLLLLRGVSLKHFSSREYGVYFEVYYYYSKVREGEQRSYWIHSLALQADESAQQQWRQQAKDRLRKNVEGLEGEYTPALGVPIRLPADAQPAHSRIFVYNFYNAKALHSFDLVPGLSCYEATMYPSLPIFSAPQDEAEPVLTRRAIRGLYAHRDIYDEIPSKTFFGAAVEQKDLLSVLSEFDIKP